MASSSYLTAVSTRLLAAGLISLLASCGGSDGPTDPPPPSRPQITTFSASPSDIAPNAASTLTYAASNADSLVLSPGGKLDTATSGTIVVNPAVPTNYRLFAYNVAGSDTAYLAITMNSYVPEITVFDANQDTIVFNDSTTITWTSLRVDSLVINQGVGKLASAVGSRFVKPLQTTAYQLVAYNNVARDTANLTVTVEVPADLRVPNGTYYRGLMGLSGTTPTMGFWVANANGSLLRKPFIHFTHLRGDGTLTAESLRVDNSGLAVPAYTFDGDESEAVIRASVHGVDSAEVVIRASHIVPGVAAQGQFIKLDDPYSTVLAFNGAPASLDLDPDYFIIYANYEAALGVVIAITDTNENNIAEGFEPVGEIILNTVYEGATGDGLGITSLASEFEAIYGDVVEEYDPVPPAAYAYRWPAWGMTAFSDLTTDRRIFEIHLYDPLTSAETAARRTTKLSTATAMSARQHRHR